jgi:hypothetical protein
MGQVQADRSFHVGDSPALSYGDERSVYLRIGVLHAGLEHQPLGAREHPIGSPALTHLRLTEPLFVDDRRQVRQSKRCRSQCQWTNLLAAVIIVIPATTITRARSNSAATGAPVKGKCLGGTGAGVVTPGCVTVGGGEAVPPTVSVTVT